MTSSPTPAHTSRREETLLALTPPSRRARACSQDRSSCEETLLAFARHRRDRRRERGGGDAPGWGVGGGGEGAKHRLSRAPSSVRTSRARTARTPPPAECPTRAAARPRCGRGAPRYTYPQSSTCGETRPTSNAAELRPRCTAHQPSAMPAPPPPHRRPLRPPPPPTSATLCKIIYWTSLERVNFRP